MLYEYTVGVTGRSLKDISMQDVGSLEGGNDCPSRQVSREGKEGCLQMFKEERTRARRHWMT